MERQYAQVHCVWPELQESGFWYLLHDNALVHWFGDFMILTVTSLYIFEILCFIRKRKIYTIKYYNIHKYNPKGNRICMSNYETLLVKSVINMGIKLHNSLPTELKRIRNFKVFKNKLNCYLLQNCFYSLKDFF
jgi:hypothetical protein